MLDKVYSLRYRAERTFYERSGEIMPRSKTGDTQSPDPRESDLPSGLSQPARRALLAAGYRRLDQLAGLSEAEVKRLHGIGPNALDQLRQALAAQGQSFADGTNAPETHHRSHPPIAQTAMLIRKPVGDVFAAFIDPAITSKFWFTKGSGKLEPGKNIQWDWEMYHASAQVSVKEVEQNRRILVEWSAYGTPTTVEWLFTDRADGTTFVRVTNTGFSGDEDTIVAHAISSTEGFTLVLAGLKALLEHDIRLNLVADRFPTGLEEG
jgi:uncharacterized protein YndB with AHSA1/START domain